MRETMNCPNCGAGTKIVGNKRVCEYCGYEELITDPNSLRNDDFYNLLVINESITQDDITISLVESNIGFIIRRGEAVAKDVPPGYHTIMVTCAGMTEYRSINVPGDGKAVKVYVAKSAFGIAIRVDDSNAPYRRPMQTNAVNQNMVLPIMALIFSFMMPFVGLILAIADLGISNKQNRKVAPLTIVAMSISGAIMIMWVLFAVIALIGSTM
jgi:hypothetical protein